MFLRRFLSMPAVLTLALAFLLGIMLVGGCPQQQVPSPPADDDDSQIDNPPDVDEPDQDRPIPPPAADGDDDGVDDGDDDGQQPPDDGDDDGGDGGDGGDDGGDDGGTAPVALRVSEPTNPMGVRPGPGVVVPFEFRLSDPAGIVSAAEIVLAPDADGNGEPDEGSSPVPRSAQTVAYVSGENIEVDYTTEKVLGLLANGYGRYVLGLRVETTTGVQEVKYAAGSILFDAVIPTATWVTPTEDKLTNPKAWPVTLTTSDNAPHTVKVLLDADTNPDNGFAGVLVPETDLAADSDTRSFNPYLSISSGTYYYYVEVSDDVQPAMEPFYARGAGNELLRVSVTRRLVSTSGDPYDLNNLTASTDGAILRGFNFNDLAGTSMNTVPDLDGDGNNELIIGSRFGKPNLATFQGQGWGEAYLIYGESSRLYGVNALNSVGGTIPGVNFRGIRVPLNTTYTQGLSDITVIDDMDGDELPELVFSFPRVESITLSADPPLQHPDLIADLTFMGEMEYDAYYGMQWNANEAQFTRGGTVIVSSHNRVLTDRDMVTRKFDRVIDLHEIGQLFNTMERPGMAKFVRAVEPNDPAGGCADCEPQVPEACECEDSDGIPENDCEAGCGECPDGSGNEVIEETEYVSYTIKWDTWLGAAGAPQGPGGFHMPWTAPLAEPPLTNPTFFNPQLPDPPDNAACDIPVGCELTHVWWVWNDFMGCADGNSLRRTALFCNDTMMYLDPDDPQAPPLQVWTGFYGNLEGGCTPRAFGVGGDVLPPTSIGCRILGQEVDDRFGVAVGSDGTWLYMSAPQHSATQADVPSLPVEARIASGAVYQLRTDLRTAPEAPNLAQLWIEPNQSYPNPDAEIENRVDYTMPTPHQYIIESVGSWRMAYTSEAFSFTVEGPDVVCVESDAPEVFSASSADYSPYPTGTAGYNTDRTPQIVGPHDNAQISFVRALGDVNADGIRDFAVGSPSILDPGSPGDIVGAVYIVYGRAVGLEGDYLLENLHLDPSDPARLEGVMLKGSSPGEKLARVFDAAGDFNGDGVADVIVGNENGSGGTGEAIVIFGDATLQSPADGWTVSDIVAAGRALRFVGESAGDLLGANVGGAGDVDGDGYDDVLISAPGVADDKGAVYLVYGSPSLSGELSLTQIGTVDLPGCKFIGREDGDMLGGGSKEIAGTWPDDATATINAFSKGVASLGDIDGDGKEDYAISAVLADPNNKTDAGEIYILYGRGD